MAGQQLEDLLRDELAGDQPVEAWEMALQAVFLRVEPSALSRIWMRNLVREAPIASENLIRLVEKAREIGALKRLDPDNELLTLAASLRLAEESLIEGLTKGSGNNPARRELFKGLQEEIDEEVFQFLSRQERLHRLINAHIDLLEPGPKERLKHAFANLISGLSEVGTERSDRLRSARTDAQFVVSLPFGEECTPALMILACAHWKLTRSVSETQRILRRAWPSAERDRDVLSHYVGRTLGRLEQQEEEHDSAWAPLVNAAEIEPDGETLIEAALLAIRFGKWEQARSLVARGLNASEIFAMRMLARPEFEEIAGDVLELLVAKQKSARQFACQELGLLSSELHRIRQCQKRSQLEFGFLDPLEDERKSIASRIANADLFLATSLGRTALQSRQEASRLATQTLSFAHATASKILEQAKSSIDFAWVERDAMIETAIASQKQAVHQAREALRGSLHGSEKVQAGCATGLGSGCGAFLLYLMIAGFLATQGIHAGFGTIFGWFGLAATIVPITICVLGQLAYGAQRAALDKVLHEKIKAAQVAYDAAAKRADQVYREKILQIKEGMGDLESRVLRLEEAMKLLNAS